jgi:hypothetical protein
MENDIIKVLGEISSSLKTLIENGIILNSNNWVSIGIAMIGSGSGAIAGAAFSICLTNRINKNQENERRIEKSKSFFMDNCREMYSRLTKLVNEFTTDIINENFEFQKDKNKFYIIANRCSSSITYDNKYKIPKFISYINLVDDIYIELNTLSDYITTHANVSGKTENPYEKELNIVTTLKEDFKQLDDNNFELSKCPNANEIYMTNYNSAVDKIFSQLDDIRSLKGEIKNVHFAMENEYASYLFAKK